MLPFDGSVAETLTSRLVPAPTSSPRPRAELLGYIEDMLLELAHMAAAGGETALAGTLAVAAIQCGGRLKAVQSREG